MWHVDRRTPYTVIGISRLGCIRCGAPAVYQWQICSDRNRYRPVCRSCDIDLNRIVLKFMNHPDVEEVINQYAQEKSPS